MWLKFVRRNDINRKTPLYDIVNSTGDNLGVIGFYPGWRKFVVEYRAGCKFDASCSQEIVDFLKSETEKWKASL